MTSFPILFLDGFNGFWLLLIMVLIGLAIAGAAYVKVRGERAIKQTRRRIPIIADEDFVARYGNPVVGVTFTRPVHCVPGVPIQFIDCTFTDDTTEVDQ